MAQVNWDRVRDRPLVFGCALLKSCYEVVKYGLSRLIAMNQPQKSTFELVARNILCNTLMSYNHLFILDGPNSAAEMTHHLRGPGFEAFSTTASENLKDNDLVILFCHGGGYGVGHPLQYRRMYQRWKKAATNFGLRLEIVALKYRAKLSRIPHELRLTSRVALSSDEPYPAALSSARAAYSYLLDACGLDCRQVCVSGDSAGGLIPHLSNVFEI